MREPETALADTVVGSLVATGRRYDTPNVRDWCKAHAEGLHEVSFTASAKPRTPARSSGALDMKNIAEPQVFESLIVRAEAAHPA